MSTHPTLDRSADSIQIPYRAIAEAWPLLRPHIREAIITLIDAELIHARLRDASNEMYQSECGPSDGRFSEP